MNKQRKVLITTTYNEMGIIIDTKAEEVAQPNLQPTCNQLATGCISRQDAIDRSVQISIFGKDVRFVAVSELENLPSVQPEQRWIPVGERLPEKHNVYLVTNSNDDVVRFVFKDTESSREYWYRCAKAWMPIPEPYTERS